MFETFDFIAIVAVPASVAVTSFSISLLQCHFSALPFSQQAERIGLSFCSVFWQSQDHNTVQIVLEMGNKPNWLFFFNSDFGKGRESLFQFF